MNELIIFFAQYLFFVIIFIAALWGIFVSFDIKKKLLKISILAFPLSYIIGKILNYFIYNPRPFVVEHVQPLIAHAADNGFPSDHTLLVMTATAVVFTLNRKLGVLLFILSLAVGVSRVMAKVHHPVDIIASMIISFVSVYFSVMVLNKRKLL